MQTNNLLFAPLYFCRKNRLQNYAPKYEEMFFPSETSTKIKLKNYFENDKAALIVLGKMNEDKQVYYGL